MCPPVVSPDRVTPRVEGYCSPPARIRDGLWQRTIHLMPLGDSARKVGDLSFLGCHLPPHVARGRPSRLFSTTTGLVVTDVAHPLRPVRLVTWREMQAIYRDARDAGTPLPPCQGRCKMRSWNRDVLCLP